MKYSYIPKSIRISDHQLGSGGELLRWALPLVLALSVLGSFPLKAELQSTEDPTANAPQMKRGRPSVDFPESTPLNKEVRKFAKKDTPKCIRAREDRDNCLMGVGNNCEDEERDVQKFCKKHKDHEGEDCPECGIQEIKRNGKKVGKRLRNRASVQYGSPGAREKEKWEDIILTRAEFGTVNDDHDCFNPTTGAHVGTSECFDAQGIIIDGLQELIDEDGPEEPLDNDGDGQTDEDPPGLRDGSDNINDDRDCLDTLTGHHKTTLECFNGEFLLQNLDQHDVNEATCVHPEFVEPLTGSECFECLDEDGLQLPLENCPEANMLVPKTSSLRELIDEDGPEEPLDNDGDGATDEDGPLSVDEFILACENLGGILGNDNSCNLNEKVKADINGRSQAKNNRPFYNDDNPFGEEPRQVTITESFALMCEGETILNDDNLCVCEEGRELGEDGQCIVIDGPSGLKGETLNGASPCGDPATQDKFCHKTMMGFTYAPPVLEWGFMLEEEVCEPLFGTCFELYFVRVGYKFDVAVGLRFPIEVEISGIPASITVGDSPVLRTKVWSRDFSVSEYAEFCGPDKSIKDCARFAFPEFFSGLSSEVFEGTFVDGAEFVANAEIFAGALARLLEVDIVNAAVDVKFGIPELCTLYNFSVNRRLVAAELGLLGLRSLGFFGENEEADQKLMQALKNYRLNCASFETPFGKKPDRLNPFTKKIRTFPVFSGDFFLRADCEAAKAKGETVTVGKKVKARCTGVKTSGKQFNVGLGLGLGLSPGGSQKLTAEWAASGDAKGAGSVTFTRSGDEDDSEVDLPGEGIDLEIENFDLKSDDAKIVLDSFSLFLDTIALTLKGRLEFGGSLLARVPVDITTPSLNLYEFRFSPGEVEIGQHAGMPPLEMSIFVENYGLTIDARPYEDDPRITMSETELCAEDGASQPMLKIRPGEQDEYLVDVRNTGSVSDDFDNFKASVEQCAAPEACGDDVKEKWQLTWPDPAEVTNVDAHSLGKLELKVNPALDGRTRPGEYSLLVKADSRTVRQACDSGGEPCLMMPDEQGYHRLGASEEFCVRVLATYHPEIEADPDMTFAKPGLEQKATITIKNAGNTSDLISVTRDYLDSNTGEIGCGLAGSGRGKTGCPYRAQITTLRDWVTDAFPSLFELGTAPNPDASASGISSFGIPSDWAGMEDTKYDVMIKAVSGESENDADWVRDKGGAATTEIVVNHTVVATLESMTRYIGLEIDAPCPSPSEPEFCGLIPLIQAANDAGINTGGLVPILLHPAKMNNERALEAVLTGDPDRAQRAHENNLHILEAFLRALNGIGRSLPEGMEADWRSRGEAILQDLNVAASATFATGSCQVSDLTLAGDRGAGPESFSACSSITWGPGEFGEVTGMAPVHVFVDGFVANGDSAWFNEVP